MQKTVVALFDNLGTAQEAVQELLDNGFGRDDISVVRTNQQGDYTTGEVVESGEGDASGAAAGAGIGAVLGGLAGLLVGLGALAIPGIGPIIAAGPLAVALAGAGVGAATGGLVGALADAGVPEDQAGKYAEGVRRGGTLVTVRVDEGRFAEASAVLDRFAPVDMSRRSDDWRGTGWTGYEAGSSTRADEDRILRSGHGEMSRSTGFSAQEGGTYEQMQDADPTVHPRSAEGDYQARRDFLGGPKVDRRFEDYDPDFRIDWESNYRSTGYGYDRILPAYRFGWQLGHQYQGRDWNDFEANARAEWERNHPDDAWQDFRPAIRLGWQHFSEPLQGRGQGTPPEFRGVQTPQDRPPADLPQSVDPGYDRTVGDMSRGFDTYDPDFRRDWDLAFRSTGYGYERYQPAYQYGYNLATDVKYRDRDWSEIASSARRDWESRHPNDAWDDFKDAVRHAWDRVRGGAQDARD